MLEYDTVIIISSNPVMEPRVRSRRTSLTVSLLVMMVAVSCGKDATGVDATPRFTGMLSGALSGNYSGVAFYDVTETNAQFFVVGYNTSNGIEFMFGPGDASGMPPLGTYAVGADASQYTSRLILAGTEYNATSGTVVFTTVSSRVVKGTFNATYEDAAGSTVTFIGAFSATELSDFPPT